MKTTVKHTPGPWQIVPAESAAHRWVVGDTEGGSVASCEPMGPWMSPAEADANARLIAAAPDLLAALKELVEDIQITGERWGDSAAGPATVALESAPNPITAEVWQQAHDAIAAAEGRR